MSERPKPIVVVDRARPFRAVCLCTRRGTLADPPGKAGLAQLTARMLTRGAAGRTRATIADDIDTLGAAVDISAGRDNVTLWADGLSRNFHELEAILADVLRHPTFPVDELEKLKRETLAELAEVRDDDEALGQRFFARTLYGRHAYGRPGRGTEATLAAITRDDLVAFHAEQLRSDDALLGAAGDVDDADLARWDALLVAPRAAPLPPLPPIAPPVVERGYRVVIVDKPDRTQTQVFIGHLALPAHHPDWTALHIGQTVFGGTFASRLTREIRERRGWSYGAYSALQSDQRLGTFTIRFYPADKDCRPALEVTDAMLHAFASEGPTADEIVAAQANLQNGHVFSIDTAPRRLSELASARLLGHDEGWVDNTVARLAATPPEAVVASVKRHLRPDDMTVVVVGTAKTLEPELSRWPPVASLEVVDWMTNLEDTTGPA